MEFNNPLFDDREGLIEGDDDEGTSVDVPPADTGVLQPDEASSVPPLSQSTELVVSAVDNFYNALAGEGLIPKLGRDYTKFGVDSQGRVYLKDRPDLCIVNFQTGCPLLLNTIYGKPGGGIDAINELGFVGWTRRREAFLLRRLRLCRVVRTGWGRSLVLCRPSLLGSRI